MRLKFRRCDRICPPFGLKIGLLVEYFTFSDHADLGDFGSFIDRKPPDSGVISRNTGLLGFISLTSRLIAHRFI